ncbi:MAG: SMR family transporter [Burkholderiaceae bacterium]
MKLTSLLVVLGSVGLTAMAQLSLKVASSRFAGTGADQGLFGGLLAQLFHPLTMAAIVAYVGSTLLWLVALRDLPLSVAYTFSGLTIGVVVLLGVVVLGEALSLPQMAGIGLIIGGLVLLARG